MRLHPRALYESAQGRSFWRWDRGSANVGSYITSYKHCRYPRGTGGHIEVGRPWIAGFGSRDTSVCARIAVETQPARSKRRCEHLVLTPAMLLQRIRGVEHPLRPPSAARELVLTLIFRFCSVLWSRPTDPAEEVT